MKMLRLVPAFILAAVQILAADRADATTSVVLDALGAATPTTTFSIFGSTGWTAADSYLTGPLFSLAAPTRITEIGAFLNNCETIISGVPQCPDTHPIGVQIRPALDGLPHPSTVLASFDLSHDNDPLTISYESVAMDLPLPAGSYFALFYAQSGEAGMLLSGSYGATTYIPDSVTFGTLRTEIGDSFVTTGPMAVRILGEPIPTLTLTQSTVLREDHSGSIVIAVDGISLDCAGHTVSGPGAAGIDLSGRNGVTVKNCIAIGFTHGFLASNARGNTLTANTARGNEVGFEIVASSGNTMRQNQAVENASHGFVVQDGSANVIEQNLSSVNGGFGYALNASRANVYRSNRAEANALQGFVLSSANGNLLESNISSANGGWNGFEIGASNDNVLVGNKALGNAAGHGFAIYLSAGVLLKNNSATDNGATGIWLDTVQTSELARNDVSRSGGSGIVLINATSIKLSDNDIRHDGTTGLVLFGTTNSTLVGNTVSDNRDHGIELNGSNGNIVERNQTIHNELVGFLVVGAAGNTLTGNIANQNGDEGFVLTSGSTGNTLISNGSMTNRVGFSVQPDATGNIFGNNVAHANADIDAEDQNSAGSNTWSKNNFGTTAGIN
jgi:parallel beta-helix repeat protein